MLEITTHHDGHGLADSIRITSDAPDPNAGGACHVYTFAINDEVVGRVQFQHGPRFANDSTPGILDSCLLAVVIDRMRAFQAGPYASRQNALVITKCEEALMWMKNRADERAARGVLGHNIK